MKSIGEVLTRMKDRDETPPVLREAIRQAALRNTDCEVRRVIDGEAQRHVEGRRTEEPEAA